MICDVRARLVEKLNSNTEAVLKICSQALNDDDRAEERASLAAELNIHVERNEALRRELQQHERQHGCGPAEIQGQIQGVA